MAGSLGADRVIDYTRDDFTRGDRRYDLLLDVAGSRPWSACRRVLTPKGTRSGEARHHRLSPARSSANASARSGSW
jgi:Zinc-binding dehydrogenase